MSYVLHYYTYYVLGLGNIKHLIFYHKCQELFFKVSLIPLQKEVRGNEEIKWVTLYKVRNLIDVSVSLLYKCPPIHPYIFSVPTFHTDLCLHCINCWQQAVKKWPESRLSLIYPLLWKKDSRKRQSSFVLCKYLISSTSTFGISANFLQAKCWTILEPGMRAKIAQNKYSC